MKHQLFNLSRAVTPGFAIVCALVVCAMLGCGDKSHPSRSPELQTPSANTAPTTGPATTQPRAMGHGGHATSKPSAPEEGVVSLDVYPDRNRLHLLIGRRPPGGAARLEYLRSDDAGKTWSDPVPVGAGQPIPDPLHRGMDAQLAAAGETLVAAWTTPGSLDRFGRGPIATAISHDGGKSWRAGANPSDDGLASGHAFIDLAAGADGVFHIVWLDGRDRPTSAAPVNKDSAPANSPEQKPSMGGKGLRYARSTDGGRTWSKNQTLDPQTCECCWNTIITGPDGRVAVLYRDFAPRDMALLTSTDSGLTWAASPTPVGAFGWDINGCPHVGGGFCFRETKSGPGACAVVWTGKGNGSTGAYVLNSDDAGASWSAPAQLGGNPKSWHADVTAAAAADGALAAVFDAYTDTASAVFASRSSDGGKTWTPPLRISDTSISATHPKVVAAGEGFRVFYTARPKAGGAITWESRPLEK